MGGCRQKNEGRWGNVKVVKEGGSKREEGVKRYEVGEEGVLRKREEDELRG